MEVRPRLHQPLAAAGEGAHHALPLLHAAGAGVAIRGVHHAQVHVGRAAGAFELVVHVGRGAGHME